MNVRATAQNDHLTGPPEAAGQPLSRARLIAWLALVGTLTAIQYAGRVASGKPDRNLLYHYSTAVAGAFTYGILLAIVLAIAAGRRDVLALRRPRSWPRALGVAFVLLIGVYLLLALLEPFLHGGREQGLTPTGWEPGHAGAYAANFLVIAVIAPIVEELMFRGLGCTLLEPYGRWTAIVVVGVLFGLAHGLFQALPELAIFGAALAWLRFRTASVYPGMLLHGTFNGISLIAAVVPHH